MRCGIRAQHGAGGVIGRRSEQMHRVMKSMVLRVSQLMRAPSQMCCVVQPIVVGEGQHIGDPVFLSGSICMVTPPPSLDATLDPRPGTGDVIREGGGGFARGQFRHP